MIQTKPPPVNAAGEQLFRLGSAVLGESVAVARLARDCSILGGSGVVDLSRPPPDHYTRHEIADCLALFCAPDLNDFIDLY